MEQYHLLQKDFDLNTLRVVKAGPGKGHEVYIYDLSLDTLYYHSSSLIELKRVLNIHPETCKKFLDSDILGKFMLLTSFIPTAV